MSECGSRVARSRPLLAAARVRRKCVLVARASVLCAKRRLVRCVSHVCGRRAIPTSFTDRVYFRHMCVCLRLSRGKEPYIIEIETSVVSFSSIVQILLSKPGIHCSKKTGDFFLIFPFLTFILDRYDIIGGDRSNSRPAPVFAV